MRETLTQFVDTMLNELACITYHPYFTQLENVKQRHDQGKLDDREARTLVEEVLTSSDSSRRVDGRSWLYEQYGWLSCLTTTLDEFRTVKDLPATFQDLDDERHRALEVLQFVYDL